LPWAADCRPDATHAWCCERVRRRLCHNRHEDYAVRPNRCLLGKSADLDADPVLAW
jgi:hypothetical protein